ncbi:ABC transporter ATP-binding protein [Priestia taiwanensis]|uniref:Multidrug ABC transporter ATP-binding protein n=1 Tax=Priestia taiwanensis TaxID=1347902 RepID=A0A917ARD5_9BACI|nr:ABC transporter ATP-binding protein [Priestia taiwanensis]MBM7363284.1 ATP-binding cassette subfamily B protein [Priestia taiwanensis]GGE69153.1 multidrug ABC transporter ATP-binding protein [Priestia taiwanensis]
MNSMRALVGYMKPYRLFAIIAPLLMVLEVAMDLLQPMIMQHIIDVGIANNDTEYVLKMSLLMIGAAVLGLVGGIGCMIYSAKASVNFATDIRQDVFQKIETFSSRNVDTFGKGKLITIVTNDIATIQLAVTMTLRILVRGPLMFLGSIIIVFFTARELFPILMVVVPIMLVAIIVLSSKGGKLFKSVQEAVDKVNTKLQENLAGIRVVKAYVRKRHEVEGFEKINNELTSRSMVAVQVVSLMLPIIMLVVSCAIVGALWLGGVQVADGIIDIGVILAFINYLNLILMAMGTISMVFMQIAKAFPSADRVQEVLTTEPDIQQPSSSYNPATVKGDVTFQNVSYSYVKNDEQVLKDISFSVQAGQMVGVIGSTGSGKTTLAKLLPRLYDVDEGVVHIDGIDVRKFELQTLRSAIGFVPQKASLFSGEIQTNIRFGKETATNGELTNAAEYACALEFIEKLEDSFAHTLTQGATNLSGGQKQRVSISRALVRKPAILILDDSTSAVDAKSEQHIQQALKEHFIGTTTFMIASKISSIHEADKILVLDNGELVGEGTHDELLMHCDVYKEIYVSQGGKVVQHG